MTPSAALLAGAELLLDPAGALFWPARGTLVVSDLHLEKGSSAALRGHLLPPWDTRSTLDRLDSLLHRWNPATVIALGDSFHDRDASARLQEWDQARLMSMTRRHRFVWVLGNHDPAPPAALGGEATDCLVLGDLMFRHQGLDGADPGELCGHHHPKARVAARGASISRPCFVTDGARLMLPAFGAYTGGLDVRDRAIRRLFPRGGTVHLLGRDRLFTFPLAGASPPVSA